MTILYHNKRRYTDPHKLPGSCGAIQKTLATKEFWPCFLLGLQALCCHRSPKRVFMRVRLNTKLAC